jgi:mannosyltransferase
MRAGVGYYLRHVAGAPADVLVCSSAADRGLLTAAECPDPGARLTGAARVWLVVYGRRADPLTGRKDLAASLATRFRRVGVWRAKAATVGLYIPAIRQPSGIQRFLSTRGITSAR